MKPKSKNKTKSSQQKPTPPKKIKSLRKQTELAVEGEPVRLGSDGRVFPFCRRFCARFGADTLAVFTKISEGPASLRSLQRLPLCVTPGGYCSRTKAIPDVGALPAFVAAMVFSSLPHAYSSALLFPRLSAPGLPVSGVSLHQSEASLCGNKPPSIFLHPTQHNGFFFFTLTQWYEKKKKTTQMKQGWRRRTSTAATIGRALVTAGRKKKKKKSIDNLGNAERTSAAAEKGEIDEEGGWRTKRWEDEAGGGQRRARS